MSISRVLVAIAVTGCMTQQGEDSDANGSGKADGEVDEACTSEYIEWLLLTARPAIEAGEAVSAASTPCRGELLGPTAYTTWLDLHTKVVFAPYMKQEFGAWEAFHLRTSATFRQLDVHDAATEPTAAMKTAAMTLAAIRPAALLDALSVQEWIDIYFAVSQEALRPLLDEALVAPIQGNWSLTPGESKVLDMLAEARPRNTTDGGFATWVDFYGDVLRDGINIDPSDDYQPNEVRHGCADGEPAPCGRDRFLDRLADTRPQAKGDLDSTRWMYELALWAPLIGIGGIAENDRAQLARIDDVRPTKLSGDKAYEKWIETVADTNDGEALTASVMTAKPCVRDLAKAETALATARLPAALLEAARPAVCD